MSLKIGLLIDGRYRVKARVGHGGMAEVYEAFDVIDKKSVAIKLIREDVMANPVNLKRFDNEALFAASLNHPNIIKVYSHGIVDGRPFIANEYVSGQNLKEILDFRGAVPLNEALGYMVQIAEAMYYAHKHNIIHRDIKPDNIYVLSDGSIKLGDFGIAQAEGYNPNTNKKEIVGSVHYLAPEIVQGKIASPLSDIYAAGSMFYELLTGHAPFENENAYKVAVAHVKEKFPSLRKYLPNAPKEIDRIIQKACRKDPRERYANAKEFADDLREAKDNPLLKEKKSLLSRLFGFK